MHSQRSRRSASDQKGPHARAPQAHAPSPPRPPRGPARANPPSVPTATHHPGQQLPQGHPHPPAPPPPPRTTTIGRPHRAEIAETHEGPSGGDSLASEDLPLGLLSPDPEDAELDRVLDGMATPSDTESMACPPTTPTCWVPDQYLAPVYNIRVLSSPSSPGNLLAPSTPANATPPGIESSSRYTHGGSMLDMLQLHIQGYPTHLFGLHPSSYPQSRRCHPIPWTGQCGLDLFLSLSPSLQYVVGTLDLMVSQDYAVVYLCAGGQKRSCQGLAG
ncbi:unnamed protein product [Boreogadus saida]